MKRAKYNTAQFNNFYLCSFCGAWTHSEYGIRFDAEAKDWSIAGTMGACPQCAEEFLIPLMEVIDTAIRTHIPTRNRYKKKTEEMNKRCKYLFDNCEPVVRVGEEK